MNINIIEKYKEEMVKNLCEIVSIPSVEGAKQKDMPFGEDVDKALKYALDLSEEIGLKSFNVDNYAGHTDFGYGEETLGIIIHLDVVPAGDNWSVDPFNPVIKDGKIYGRGTTDNKGSMIAILYALKAIIDSGVVPKKKIRVIYGTNEETRWEGIEYYLKKFKAPDFTIVPDALFPIVYAEKGIVSTSFEKKVENDILILKQLTGGNALNSVADSAFIEFETDENDLEEIINKLNSLKVPDDFVMDYEKTKNSLKISVKGISAHASVPENGANSISFLANVLVNILPEKSSLFELAKFIDTYIPIKGYDGNNMKIDYNAGELGVLTFNLGKIEYDDKIVKIKNDIRYPVSMDYKEIEKNLKEVCNKNDFILHIIKHLDPIYHELDSDNVKTLINAYVEMTNDKESKPVSFSAATYARALPNAISFGGQMQSDEVIPHQDDEYITIKSLITMSKIYAKAIYDLACK